MISAAGQGDLGTVVTNAAVLWNMEEDAGIMLTPVVDAEAHGPVIERMCRAYRHDYDLMPEHWQKTLRQMMANIYVNGVLAEEETDAPH
jgi:hypothetical protein